MYGKFLFDILMKTFAVASPEIMEGIRNGVADMVKRADETANPWDDFAVGLLQMIVGKPKEPIADPDD